MSSHFIPQRAQRLRATDDRFKNSAFGPEGDDAGSPEDAPQGNGWFDSSFELRRGLDVIEWVLPEVGPGPAPPQ